MFVGMHPRRQGDLGEASALHWLAEAGAAVFVPFGHAPHYDLVADFGDRPLRVQVKTSTVSRNARWEVVLCTRGGNRSWSGVVQHFSAERCDRLFVVVGDGRRWWIPSDAVCGGTGILLGGPKYAAYEIEPGSPLERPSQAPDRYPSASRRGTEAVKRAWL